MPDEFNYCKTLPSKQLRRNPSEVPLGKLLPVFEPCLIRGKKAVAREIVREIIRGGALVAKLPALCPGVLGERRIDCVVRLALGSGGAARDAGD